MTRNRPIRPLVVVLLLAFGAVAALSFSGSADAKTTKCGEKVLADWYDNGRIDRLYPLNCYEDAIDAIPSDIGPYVDAADVITRALQGALRGELVAGGCDPSADGDPKDCTRQPGGGVTPGNNDGNGGSGGGTGSSGGGSGGSDGGSNPQAAPDVNTSSPSSVPVPLLVLGGMSILLLAAGSLGYLSRRRQAVHADDLDGPGNPTP